jgi:hypothetical protein
VASSNIPQAQALIPGAYEQNTLTHRQMGSMGGPASGSADLPVGRSSLSAATVADREMEGGGGVSQRPRRVAPQPQGAVVPAGKARNAFWSTAAHSWFPLWLRLARR